MLPSILYDLLGVAGAFLDCFNVHIDLVCDVPYGLNIKFLQNLMADEMRLYTHMHKPITVTLMFFFWV